MEIKELNCERIWRTFWKEPIGGLCESLGKPGCLKGRPGSVVSISLQDHRQAELEGGGEEEWPCPAQGPLPALKRCVHFQALSFHSNSRPSPSQPHCLRL